MDKRSLLPQFGLIAGTRVALGAGIGLLVAEKLDPKTRKGAGSALLAMGALTTVPLIMGLWQQLKSSDESPQPTT